MTLQEMLEKDPRWQKLKAEQNHRIIESMTLVAIRTPWLYSYQDSSRGHAGARKLLKKIVKADESVFTGINNEPFDIEKYVRRA